MVIHKCAPATSGKIINGRHLTVAYDFADGCRGVMIDGFVTINKTFDPRYVWVHVHHGATVATAELVDNLVADAHVIAQNYASSLADRAVVVSALKLYCESFTMFNGV